MADRLRAIHRFVSPPPPPLSPVRVVVEIEVEEREGGETGRVFDSALYWMGRNADENGTHIEVYSTLGELVDGSHPRLSGRHISKVEGDGNVGHLKLKPGITHIEMRQVVSDLIRYLLERRRR
uniref:Uncharacterized protein n=1 Tax=Palpitomonas bilix TaxID=652834 RepID=A0A7S3G6A3_9EUKA|mmetsp:Transcript_22745/g.57936  ORF Transcript_22745/g.57936 Transcript_22745/m.57936 type:complete len:123 (+) Transcript_22745:246-614(+)|eukprot:CAMPEP_0113874160 /NCGR_PEP_ID=MMETSP0780_2-20120614/4178_1 /TAXON_ID=652834 /ORGANISM="Palpitomonas bilix" /LENGTH=122 /DNA_ID=CAMNT_0000859899 /DNA_START=237 /DNA_END=605 /DNA_ORIENTATION=+ /assembly_acc=CAM_ASM_000599